MYRKFGCVAALCLTLAMAGAAVAQQGVLFEYWENIGGGTAVSDLTSNPLFPDSPTSSEVRDEFMSPVDWADNAGTRARAYLMPPETGDYTFWVAGDDACQLWLSSDADPANAVMIAQVTGWTPAQDWFGSAGVGGGNQQSAPIALQAGQVYYIEGLEKEGGGGDSLGVAWAGPGIGDEPTVIAGQYCIAVVRLLARNPKPADGAVDVTNPLFEWTAGDTAVAHDIYLGTTPDLTDADYRTTMPVGLYYYLDPLVPGMTYYWRVDEVDASGVKTTGKVWSFTVMPLEANTPSPADGIAFAPLDVTLSWKGGQGATTHDVFFGMDQTLVAAGDAAALAGTVTETSFALSGLAPETTYYWRVDEVDGITGRVEGPVWSFSTLPVVAPIEDTSLVGWWTFDTEPANSWTVLDMSGNGHYGVIEGALSFADDFYMGRVLKLPGGTNQDVKIGAVGISGNDPTTIACWAKADSTSIPDWTLIFGFTTVGGGNGSHFNIGSLGGPGGVGAHVWGWEETIFSDQEALEWHHYAMTYDGTTIAYYGDGIPMDTDEAKSNVQDLSIRGDYMQIGSRITQDSSFPGMVDDCRVYNRVLSADEIAAIGTNPAKIVWVSFHPADDVASAGAAGVGFTDAPDKPYTDLLEAQGYNVRRYVTTDNPDAAVLNAADLVIISRSVASSGYQNDGATRWNNISAPMMILGGYVTRDSRMGFTTGGTMVDTTGDITLTVTDPTHPIFAGIALTDGTMDNPFAGLAVYPSDGTTAAGISINNNPLDDEGILLASISEASAATGPAGGMVIAEWPAGATLVHAGGAGTDVLGGPRLVFLTGSRENGGKSSETAGMYDLSDDGALMFLNAVDYMINPPAPVVEPSANILTNGGFEDGVIAPYGTYGTVTATVVTDCEGADVAEGPIEGVYCLHLEVPAAGANNWDVGMTNGTLTLEAGKKYTFSAWMKTKSGTLDVRMKPELSADPWTGYTEAVVTVTDTWQEFHTTTDVLTETVTPFSPTFHMGFAAGDFWIDNVQVYEGDYVAQ